MSKEGARRKTTPKKSEAKTSRAKSTTEPSIRPKSAELKIIRLTAKDDLDLNAFSTWFWADGKRANNLIEAVNKCETRSDFIRREKHRTHIYCIALDFDFEGLGKWRFCKVGITLVEEGADYDRVEIVKKKIEKANDSYKTDIVFRLPIRAIDTTNVYDIERRLRTNMGVNVSKALAETLELPNKTEWALTQKSFIDKVKKEAKKKDADTSILGYDGPFGIDKSQNKKDIRERPPLEIKYDGNKINLRVQIDEKDTVELHGDVREE